MLKKDPPRKKDIIDLSDNAIKKTYINLDDEGPGSERLGTLIVVLLKAKDLNDKHFRKQDVFAQATLNGITKKTKVDARAGQHPVWDEEVRFQIVNSKRARNRKLEVSCYSQEPHPLADQLLGKAVIDLTDLLKTGEFDEWVELDVDGVQRGEIYLEMTYFSNDPEPDKPSQPAAAPTNKILSNVLETDFVGLQRRPSKLSPADRLSRPRHASTATGRTTPYPQSPQPSAQQQLLPNQGGRPLSLAPSYVASPQDRWDARPPPEKQELLPNQGGRPLSLAPSYIASPQSRWETRSPLSDPQKPESSLPSLLRPGGGRTPPSSSPVPIPQLVPPTSYGNHRRPSPSPPSQSPYLGPQFGISPPITPNLNPYIAVAPSPHPPGLAQNPHMLAQTPPPNQPGPSAHWRQDNYSTSILDPSVQSAGGFVMPISLNTGPHSQDPLVGRYPPTPQIGYGGGLGPSHVRAGSDPILRARYSTPLPLPPGASPRAQPVVRTPPSEIPPPSYPPMLPSKENKPTSDPTRFQAHRHAEDAANRKREQEIRDMEIAMQLDRELNSS